ncbi:LysR family transcriptional regulator [Zwartia vadi]|uniref:LysR family transcriptional regulator n=1 Tax=Zwartia vadi TaxID=3058168 RepID=UPI0025B49BF3|nr:LysR family transcriptional regulator [Zwartia vadi]MDN3987522.1 LysR family transcriptional regulator [Zwartia vadi]
MDRFDAMRAFVAVVDAGSFVGGADRLQISKAVVSRLVAELEEHLGVRLLHRTTRKLSLTPEGDTYVGRCRNVLLELQEAEDDVTHRSAQARGILRINVPVSYGLSHLAALWPAFMEKHPEVILDITLSDRVVDLVEEGYDLAVRIGKLESSTLVSRRLSRTRMVLCASPGYIEKYSSPRMPEDLSQHRIFAYSLLSSGDQWLFTSEHDAKRQVSVRIAPVMRTNNGDTCRAAALQDQGIVLQPDFLIGDDIRTGRLVELMPAWRAGELGIHAVYPSRRYLSAKVRLLVDYLADQLSK